MEEIQKHLGKFGKIQWYKIEIKDFSNTSLKKLLLNTSPISITLFVLLPFWILNPFDIYMIIFIVSMLGFIPLGIYICIRSDKKIMKSYNLTRKQLIKYEKLWALTKEKWIQKNLDENKKLYPEDLPINVLERHNDIIFANLDSVKAVMIAETEPENYRIWIYVDESFTEYDDPHLGVEIETWEEFDGFMRNFKKFVPLDEPEGENVGYGVKFTYYLSEKFKNGIIL